MSFEWEHDDGIRVTTRRARVVKVDDEKSQQRVDIKGLKKEKPEKVWRPMDFGFTSNPPEDCDGVLIQMGSRSDRTLYLDAGHEKYRPKKKDGIEQGDTAIFNHNGDVVKVLKKQIDVAHAELINLRIGKGYKTGGDSAGGEGDDSEEEEETTVSLVIKKGDSITITFADSSVKLESGKITHTSPLVVIKSPDINLGGEGGEPIGLCGGGCSTTTKAI